MESNHTTTLGIDDSSRISILVEEYKLCADRADKFSALIWNLATLLLTLSTGIVVFLPQLKTEDLPTLFFVEALEVAVSLGLRWWNRVADRWNSYISAWYARMKEIEEILGNTMWANRYIDILDKYAQKKELAEQEKEKLPIILGRLDFKKHSIESINQLRRQLMLIGVSALGVLIIGFQAWSTWNNIPLKNHRIILIVSVLISWFIIGRSFYQYCARKKSLSSTFETP